MGGARVVARRLCREVRIAATGGQARAAAQGAGVPGIVPVKDLSRQPLSWQLVGNSYPTASSPRVLR